MADKNPLPFRTSIDSVLKGLRLGLHSIDAGDQISTVDGSCAVGEVTLTSVTKSTAQETLKIEYDDETSEDKVFAAGHVIVFDLAVSNSASEANTQLRFAYTTSGGEKLRVQADLQILDYLDAD